MGLLGLHDKGMIRRGHDLLYVHRGNWTMGLPPRLGSAPEIAVFDLVPATSGMTTAPIR